MQVSSAVAVNGSYRQGKLPDGSAVLRRLLGKGSEFIPHAVDAPRRAEVEQYIATRFARAYDADVTEFASLLLELNCAGSTSGVAGVRMAGRESLFLEHYLDAPIETVASMCAGEQVFRDEIVELCNLAALRPGACQLINLLLAAILHDAGCRYASFAGTSQLERIVRKQHFSVLPIAVADPARLGSAALKWGNYYDSKPNVLLVDLARTMESLQQLYVPAAIFSAFATTIKSVSQCVQADRLPLLDSQVRA